MIRNRDSPGQTFNIGTTFILFYNIIKFFKYTSTRINIKKANISAVLLGVEKGEVRVAASQELGEKGKTVSRQAPGEK